MYWCALDQIQQLLPLRRVRDRSPIFPSHRYIPSLFLSISSFILLCNCRIVVVFWVSPHYSSYFLQYVFVYVYVSYHLVGVVPTPLPSPPLPSPYPTMVERDSCFHGIPSHCYVFFFFFNIPYYLCEHNTNDERHVRMLVCIRACRPVVYTSIYIYIYSSLCI
jgi:hypothetical protein